MSWQNLFEGFIEISASMPEPDVRVGDKIAWVTAEEQFLGRRSSGEEVSATLLGTSVFRARVGRWLMVHHHVLRRYDHDNSLAHLPSLPPPALP